MKEMGWRDRFCPSLAGDWVGLFGLWAVLLSGVEGGVGEKAGRSGTARRVKGRRVGRVKRSRVSPGSLCCSLVPAVHSCSFSSLSAGCTAARWCL